MSSQEIIIDHEPIVEVKAEAEPKKPISTVLISAITAIIVGGITSTAVFYTLTAFNAGDKAAELKRFNALETNAATTQKALEDKLTTAETQLQTLSQKLASVETTAKSQISTLEKKLETLTLSGISSEVKLDLERLKSDANATKTLTEKLSLLDSKQSEMGILTHKTLTFNAGQQLLAKLETNESFSDELQALERITKDLTQDGAFSLSAKTGFISTAQLLTAYTVLKPVKQEVPVEKTWFEEKLAPLTHLIKVKRKDDAVKLEAPALEKALQAGNTKQALSLWQQQQEAVRKTYTDFDTMLTKANQQQQAKAAFKTKLAEILK